MNQLSRTIILSALFALFHFCWARITSGSTHTCALTTTNDVYCWGENQYGQLGDGEISESRTTPIKVQELSDIYSISAGGRHTCALLKTNQVKCWGRNEKGQLGDGTNVTSSTVPVDVVGLSTVQEIATYANHSCARLLDGSMRCWGSNDYGRLGDGTQLSRNIPVAVVGLGGPVANLGEGGAFNIAGDKYGGEFTCAVLVNGNAQCWGYNSYGELGDGSGGLISGSAVIVTGLPETITAISVGVAHSCALSIAQQLYCWGRNDIGQLGDGTLLDRSTPVSVTGPDAGVTAIATGELSSCALMVIGAVKCWGRNWGGILGVDTTIISASVPITVTGLTSGTAMIQIGVLKSSHYAGQPTHACAIVNPGVVKCWGSNIFGELGDGTIADRWQPKEVTGLQRAARIVTVGFGFSCALLDDGTVNCWGDNRYGALGDGTFKSSKVPVQTVGLTNPTNLVSGSDHSCVIDEEGQVKCWGYNGYFGQLGDGTMINRGIPTSVIGLPKKATDLAAGYQNTCALIEDGTVYCWGSNFYGQLGNVYQELSSFIPVATQHFSSPAIQISTRDRHVCALLQNGQVYCWGDNTYGQLGNGGAWRTTPTYIASRRLYLPLVQR